MRQYAIAVISVFLAVITMQPAQTRGALLSEVLAARPSCDFSSQIQEFKALKEEVNAVDGGESPEDNAEIEATDEGEAEQISNMDPQEKDLALRKGLFVSATDCMLSDLQGVEKLLEEAPAWNAAAKEIRDDIISRIQDAISFLEAQKGLVVKEDVTKEDISNVAKKLIDWRAGTYEPLGENARNFIIWVNNQDLIEKTQNRLFQVRNTLRTLRLDNKEEVRIIYENAKVGLLRAEDSHRMARQALERGKSSEEVLAPIKATLDNLNKTYQTLFSLSESIPKFLKR